MAISSACVTPLWASEMAQGAAPPMLYALPSSRAPFISIDANFEEECSPQLVAPRLDASPISSAGPVLAFAKARNTRSARFAKTVSPLVPSLTHAIDLASAHPINANSRDLSCFSAEAHYGFVGADAQDPSKANTERLTHVPSAVGAPAAPGIGADIASKPPTISVYALGTNPAPYLSNAIASEPGRDGMDDALEAIDASAPAAPSPDPLVPQNDLTVLTTPRRIGLSSTAPPGLNHPAGLGRTSPALQAGLDTDILELDKLRLVRVDTSPLADELTEDAGPAQLSADKFEIHRELGLEIDGVSAAPLKFRQTLGGLDVRLDSLLETVKGRFPGTALDDISSSHLSEVYIPVTHLHRSGVPISYNPVRDVFELESRNARIVSTNPAEPITALPLSTMATQDLGAPSVLPREQELQLPVLVDGFYRGDADVVVGADNRLRVRINSLLTALERVLKPEVIERLQALPTRDGLVEVTALEPYLTLTLDESTIEINAAISTDARPERGLSLAAEDRFANLEYVQPENFAAAFAVDFGGAYSFRAPSGFQGESGRVASWVNIGGADGVFVDAEFFYESSAESQFRRGDIRISKDDPENAIRYSAGDILYLSQGFQGAPRIGGVGVQRLYEELDPLRIIRPQGRTSFTLDRAATVEIIVNGVPFRTIRFDPGTYNLNDIPFAEGGNNVELLIRDDSGIERRLEFNSFSSANLLAEGLSEFGIVAGFLSDFTPSGISYDSDEPVVSGFYRIGLGPTLTVGANAQASRDVGQVGGEIIYAVSDLLVSARGALSHLDRRGTGYSWEVNAQYRPLDQAGINTFFLEGTARSTSRDFAALGVLDPVNDFRLETAVRGGFALGQSSNVSLGFTRQFGRDDTSDISRYSLTASRRFGAVAAFATFDRREVQGQPSDDRILFTVSLPLGRRSSYARATFDSDRNAFRAEVQRLPRGAVGDLSGTLAIETNDDGQELLGQVRYRHNRFIAGLDNAIVFDSAQSDISTAVTRYSVRSGIGFTDGSVLVSPTLGEGSFVAVSKGDAIKQGQVLLNDSPIGPQAVSDGLGPAAFGGLRGYVPTRITADVDTEEPGFEGASQTVNLLPGARTGYKITIGSEATAIVIATIVLPSGEPASLVAGLVERLDGTGAPIDSFTNRSGRLVAEGVTEGDYRFVVPGRGQAVFTISKDQLGIVRLADLVLRPVEKDGDTE